MPIYTVPCLDGGDPQCEKTIQVEIAIPNLTTEQIAELREHEFCEITPEQVQDAHLELDEKEKDNLEKNGYFRYSEDVEYCCSACGSDYTRDDDGKIVD